MMLVVWYRLVAMQNLDCDVSRGMRDFCITFDVEK
jgi:hypothetical protein